jgi:excisionase family DNA binding protein
MDSGSMAACNGLGAASVRVEEREYYSITQAAALLGVNRVSIWRWIRDGRLPAARIGHRTTRIRREDLDALLLQSPPRTFPATSSQLPANSALGAIHDLSAREPRLDWTRVDPSEHLVQFYEADRFLLDTVAQYLGAALAAGDVGIAIASHAHLAGLAERLGAAGIDLASARVCGRYLEFDALETLSKFQVDGMPDPKRFHAVVGRIVADATAGGARVRIFGAMVSLLVADGNHAAAIRLEDLWNDLLKIHPFTLFCGYPMDQFGGESFSGLFDTVAAAHTRVIPAESYMSLATADDRLRAIAVLQQRASWLEVEIAERKRAEERLRVALAGERVARQEAEAALQLRDEFLSIAAHELKTPLTSLVGQAQLILRRLRRDEALDPARIVQALDAISDQAGKLSQLLNQLLDVSRLESGKLTLERQPADLALLVERAVSATRAVSDAHSFNVTLPETLTALVDPLRFEQVLTNLLDNAVKYSPDGGSVDVVLAQRDDGAVRLSVRDRGLGIPEEQRGQIFERFYQAHENGHQQGLGLGLYICRQIVELHGGEIRAEFPPDGGTSFVVRLPLQQDDAPASQVAD